MSKQKERKCKAYGCKNRFVPISSFHVACSLKCSLKIDAAKKRKREATERRVRKKKIDLLRPMSYWVKKAQKACNAYIRERDKKEPCISCGRYHKGQYHAGHFLTTSSRPWLRFHPFNINKQCMPCNAHLSGNITLYRDALIKKIGLENVEWLENSQPGEPLSVEDIKEIEQHYKKLLKMEQCK